jgi:hypothetical protein
MVQGTLTTSGPASLARACAPEVHGVAACDGTAGAPSPRARLLTDFVRELDARRVPYCVLRGHATFPDLHPGGDIDLLTTPEHAHAVAELAAELAAREGISVWQRRRTGFLERLDFHALAAPGRHEFFGVDVHASEACFGVPFLAAHDVLANVRRENGLPRPAPATSACIDAFGAFLSGGTLPERYARTLHTAAERDPAAVEAELARWFGAARAHTLVRAIRASPEFARTLPLGGLRRALLARAFVRAPIASSRAFLAFAWGVRVRPWWRPRGRSVVFLGTDGTGKSTVLAGVLAALRPVFGAEYVHTFHLRPGVLPQLGDLVRGRIRPARRSTASAAEMASPHRARPSGRLASTLRAAYYACDYVLGHALRVLPLRRRTVIVAFDRYVYDYRVDPLRSRIRRDAPGLALLCKLCPAPDRIVVCSAPLATVRARKTEISAEESQRQLELYAAFADENPRARVVETTGSVQDAVDAALVWMFAQESEVRA